MRTAFNFKFSRLYSRKTTTPESINILVFTTKVSLLIYVEGGKALCRLLNDLITCFHHYMTFSLKLVVE